MDIEHQFWIDIEMAVVKSRSFLTSFIKTNVEIHYPTWVPPKTDVV